MNIFKSANHKHPFIKIFKDDGWRCDGYNVFGKCKSNLDRFNKSFGKARYKCKICDDFDFCQLCLNAENISNKIEPMISEVSEPVLKSKIKTNFVLNIKKNLNKPNAITS